MTRRREMADLLRDVPLGIYELSKRFGVPVKVVLEDLEHVRRSVRGAERFVIEPALCLSCDFVFEARSRLTRPSRCPKCRGEQIEDAAFRIVMENRP